MWGHFLVAANGKTHPLKLPLMPSIKVSAFSKGQKAVEVDPTQGCKTLPTVPT